MEITPTSPSIPTLSRAAQYVRRCLTRKSRGKLAETREAIVGSDEATFGLGRLMNHFELNFGTNPIRQVDDALALYALDEFQSPTRSTVPLLSLLKHGGEVWKRIAEELTGTPGSIEAHLEFQVKPPRGRGKPSCTDLMLLTSKHAVAIEAKWTEPSYETVSTWLSSQNRQDVLEGWLSLLQPFTSIPLTSDIVASAAYQTVHRAASACHSKRDPKLVYLQFTPLPTGRAQKNTLIQELTRLHAAIGAPSNFPFSLVEAMIEATDAFNALVHLPKGAMATANAVTEALRNGPLFGLTGSPRSTSTGIIGSASALPQTSGLISGSINSAVSPS